MGQPAKSWSTGDGKNDGITNHYERILAKNRNINGTNHNDAKRGAKMVDLQGQVNTASVTQKVECTTTLMSANDVCTSSKDTMPSAADFRAQFRAVADTIQSSGTTPVVYVLSIPNIYPLYLMGKDDGKARSAWKNYDICQSMLSESNTEEGRQHVLQRNKEFNDILAQEPANYGFYWDGYRLFNDAFTLDMLSTIDYFHPSVKGQATLASESWAAGPYAGMA